MTTTIIAIAAIIGAIVGAAALAVGTGEGVFAFFGAIVGGVVVGAIAFGITIGYSNPRDLTCYVDNKDRARTDSGSDARVYTRECGVLNVQDLMWAREFDSADTWAKIEPGHTYQFHVTGVRIGFFSVFPHIRTAEQVKP